MISRSVISLTDILPTLVDLAGGRLPQDRIIDGRSFARILQNDEHDLNSEIHPFLLFYCDARLMAVRYKMYKVHYWTNNVTSVEELQESCPSGVPKKDYFKELCFDAEKQNPPLLYNIERDPSETFKLPVEEHQDILDDIAAHVRAFEKTLVGLPEPLLKYETRHQRHTPCCNPPYCVCNKPYF